MTQPPRQPDDPAQDDAHDETIGRLINEFFDRRAGGEAVSEDGFIAEHAEHADDLREHLQGLNLIRGIGSSSGDDPLAPGRTQSAFANLRAEPDGDLDEIHIPEIPGYRIQRALGRGGMGIVYKAVQQSTGRQVALKVLLEGPFAAPQARKRFEREISLSAQLKHSNIIPIYDSGRCDGRLYYAMEYVRGVPLNEYVQRDKPNIKRRLELFAKVGESLRHAHQRGVIHRDLKPSNILVRADGEPHLLDFGLAKQGTFGDMTTSLTAQIIGTPAYMSPEQAAGDPTGIDVRTDVYSLGVVLYEMLSGEMPYATNVSIGQLLNNIARAQPDESHLVVAGVDPALIAICLKALEKNKDARYQSVDTFVADVRHFLADEPISVRPASGFRQFRRSIWKHRVTIAILGVAAMLFAAAGLTLHKILSTLNEKQEQIAIRDEQIEAHEEQDRRLEDEIRRHQAQKEVYRRALEMMDPNYAESVKALNELINLNPAAFSEIMRLVAKGAGDIAESAEPAPAIPGKDLEAGIREYPLSGVNPDRLTESKPEPDKSAWILDMLESLSREAPARKDDAGPTTQPADETTSNGAADAPTSAPSDSDKS